MEPERRFMEATGLHPVQLYEVIKQTQPIFSNRKLKKEQKCDRVQDMAQLRMLLHTI
jgi:hypothetical protein